MVSLGRGYTCLCGARRWLRIKANQETSKSTAAMSFLNQLKNQAEALQSQTQGAQAGLKENTQATEMACRMASKYLQDLCAQLNVISPPAAGSYTLDGKTPWPNLVMRDFRADARKKMLRGVEAFDYIGCAWRLIPSTGQVAQHRVAVNFPPDLERVVQRLSNGQIKHERKEQRHPETNKLQAYVFEYTTESRGSVTLTPDHDKAQIAFRVGNVGGFEILNAVYPSSQVTSSLMDELAKKLVGQVSRFG